MKKLTLTIDRGTTSDELKRGLIKEITAKSTSLRKVATIKGTRQPITPEQLYRLKTAKPIINILKVVDQTFQLIASVKKDEEIIDLEPNTEYEIRTNYTQRTDQDVKWAYKIGGDEKKSIQNQSTVRFKTPSYLIAKEDDNFILVSIYTNNRLKDQTKVLITCLNTILTPEEPRTITEDVMPADIVEEEEEIELKNPFIIISDLSDKKPKEVINTNKDGQVVLNPNKKYRVSTYGISGEGLITWTQNIDSTKPTSLHGELVDLTPDKTTNKGQMTCSVERGEITEGFTTLKVIVSAIPPPLPQNTPIPKTLSEDKVESTIERIEFLQPGTPGKLTERELNISYPFEFKIYGKVPEDIVYEVYINRTPGEITIAKQTREILFRTDSIEDKEYAFLEPQFEKGKKYTIIVRCLNKKGQMLTNKEGRNISSTIGIKII